MLDTLESCLHEQLKDLYSAEAQLTKALPRLAKAASDPELQDAFETHLEETRGHMERLEQAGESLGMSMKGKKCKGMEGLIEEGKEVLEEDGSERVIDAAYEISAYGSDRRHRAGAGDWRAGRGLRDAGSHVSKFVVGARAVEARVIAIGDDLAGVGVVDPPF